MPLSCGYALNRSLAGRDYSRIERPAETVLMFESDAADRNAAGGPDSVAMPLRHGFKSNFALADGNVRSMTDRMQAALVWEVPPDPPIGAAPPVRAEAHP